MPIITTEPYRIAERYRPLATRIPDLWEGARP